MNELRKMMYGGYEEILEEKIEEIDKQAKVIQWYEKENRHNQEIIIKDIKEIEEHKNTIATQQQEIERLNNIIKEALNYIDDNTYYKDHKGNINIDDLYIILQKGIDEE